MEQKNDNSQDVNRNRDEENHNEDNVNTQSSIDTSSALEIELENNGGDDSQLEPGEVKDDDEDEVVTTTLATTLSINFNNFCNKFDSISQNDKNSNNSTVQPVLSKEMARKRLKALGNMKKIQMESKKYLDNHNNKIGNNSNINKKDKPPTPHEKAELTKQEIEKMKKREERALPCYYYDSTLIHRIRADTPNKSSMPLKSILKKSSEINKNTSSLEAIKNYNNDDDHNNVDYNSNDSYDQPIPTIINRRASSASSSSSFVPNRRPIINKFSPRKKYINRNQRSFGRYSNNQKQSTYFNSRRSYHHRDNQNYDHISYHNKNKFPNRFDTVSSSSSSHDNKFKDNNIKLRHTKTKPVISYAFNPNINVDPRFISSPSPLPSSAMNNLNNNNGNNDDDKKCSSQISKKNHKNVSSISLSDNESGKLIQKDDDSREKLKSSKKKKSPKKSSRKNKLNRSSSSRSSTSSISTKKRIKLNKVVKNEIRPSFEGNEDDIEDEEENQKVPIDEDETLFEEDTSTFPLSKDETVSAIVATDDNNENNEISNAEDVKNIKKQLPPPSSSEITNERDVSNKKNKLVAVDNKSPDTDDYMANWEEEEDTNLCETSTATNIPKDQLNDRKPINSYNIENDPSIFTDCSVTKIGLNIENSDTEDGEIKDGLGTPIFVNPSPPSELIDDNQVCRAPMTTETTNSNIKHFSNNSTRDSISEDLLDPFVNDTQISDTVNSIDTKNVDNSNTEKEAVTKNCPSTSTSTHLFGMQHIYEQFIQSVSEAGIDLSSEKHPVNNQLIISEPLNDNDNYLNSKVPKSQQIPDKENSKSEIIDDQHFSPDTTPPLLLPRRRSSTSSTSSTHSTSSLSSSDNSSSSSSSTSSPSSTSSSSLSSSTTLNNIITKPTHLNESKRHENTIAKNEKEKVKIIKSISENDNQKLNRVNLSSEDRKRIRALQKRRKMLKNLQKQSEEMDDEDKQCLLSVTKLIEAEQTLLMRKFNLTTLENLLIQELSEDDLDEEDDGNKNEHEEKEDDNGDGKMNSINDATIKSDDKVDDNTSNVNREIVKLKIALKVPKRTSVKTDDTCSRSSDAEDQDFTEKLMRSSMRKEKSDSTSQRNSGESHRSRSHRRSNSRSRSQSSSPKNYRSNRARSLSLSPAKYRHDSPNRRVERKTYWKRRYHSPSPKKSRNSDYRRSGYRRSREKNRYYSPPSRRGSRSPYNNYRQLSHSPLHFRPPSPTTTPPQNSREPSKERSKSPYSSDDNVSYKSTNDIENWETYDHIPVEYYINSLDNYYYLMPQSNDGTLNDDHSKEAIRMYSYDNYTHYNSYPNDYISDTVSSSTSEGGYLLNYGNEYISSYSKIPVIETSLNAEEEYYYGSSEATQVFITAENSVTSESTSSQLTTDETGKSSTVVVQKGNVLEIVPASIVSTSFISDNEKVNDSENNSSIVDKISNGNNKKKSEKKKKRRSSWEEEVAKRHIMSAVLRLNKENDGVIKGILSNKTHIDEQPKQKKRVIFADGIPPGKSSSDEDILQIKSQKKKKKKHRSVDENKENENETDSELVEMKIDPELYNLPPPSPPPGSPPPHLPQPVLIRKPQPLLYFHYDSVVNSMYVSEIPTPIPPRLLNKNLESNSSQHTNFCSSSSMISEINTSLIATTTVSCAKTSLTENTVESSIPTSKIFTSDESLSQKSIDETNIANGTVSNFDQNKSLIPSVSTSCISQIPVQTTVTNNNQQINVQQFPPTFGNFAAQPPRMLHFTGQRVPSPILRQLSNGQIPGGIMNHRPLRRNSPRIIRPNFIIPPLRNNLLSLTPGPEQPIRHFQSCRPPMVPFSSSPYGQPAQQNFHNQIITVQSNSSQTFCDDGSPAALQNPPFFGRTIPSVIGKTVLQQNQPSSAPYNGNPTLLQPRHLSIVPRPIRNFTPRPQSPLVTHQFGVGGSSFNQTLRIPLRSSTPSVSNHFMMQQRPFIRPVPMVRIPSISPTIHSVLNVPIMSERQTNNTVITPIDNPGPLIYPSVKTTESNVEVITHNDITVSSVSSSLHSTSTLSSSIRPFHVETSTTDIKKVDTA